MGLSDEPYHSPRRPEQVVPEAVAAPVGGTAGNMVSLSDADFCAEMILE